MKDNVQLKEKFLEYFRDVPVQKYAAAYIGRHEDTITDWKKADSDFSDQIDLAKAEYVRQKLKGVRSKEWILERLFKDHFAPRQELTGKDGEALVPTPILGGKTEDAVSSDNSNK